MAMRFVVILLTIGAMLAVDFNIAFAQRYNNYQWQRQQQLQIQRQQQQQQLRQRQLQQQRQRQLQQQRQRQLQQQRQRQLQQQRQRQLQQDRARTQQQVLQGQRQQQNNSRQTQQRQSQQRADQLRQRREQARVAASSNRCSFHGGTLVLTKSGMIPIRDIETNEHHVWAKDEFTGEVGWKTVVAHYSNTYDETVIISVLDPGSGEIHRIISNRVHPFFVAKPNPEIPVVNVRHHPSADDLHLTGTWLSADALQAGHRVLSADGTLDVVESVSIVQEALQAFNLTVAGFHTFFVSGAFDAEPIWVHNDCLQIVSRISRSQLLMREAERAGRSHQIGIDRLTAQLRAGNTNPGLGSRPIGGGISEARGRDGSRVYWMKRGNNIEVLAKSSKSNQDKVIRELRRIYEF